VNAPLPADDASVDRWEQTDNADQPRGMLNKGHSCVNKSYIRHKTYLLMDAFVFFGLKSGNI
jgi:hypothetical protein